MLNNKSCIKQAHNEIKSLFNTSSTPSITKSKSQLNQSSANTIHSDVRQYSNLNRVDDINNEYRYSDGNRDGNGSTYNNDNSYGNNLSNEEKYKIQENKNKHISAEHREFFYENDKRNDFSSSRRNSENNYNGSLPVKYNDEDEDGRFRNKSPSSLSQNMKYNNNNNNYSNNRHNNDYNDNNNNNTNNINNDHDNYCNIKNNQYHESVDRSRRNSNEISHRDSISNLTLREVDPYGFINNKDPQSTVRTGESNPYSTRRLSSTEILLNSEFSPNSKNTLFSSLPVTYGNQNNDDRHYQSNEYVNDAKGKREIKADENDASIQSKNILFPSSSRRESYIDRNRNKVDFENENQIENIHVNSKEEGGGKDKDIHKTNDLEKRENANNDNNSSCIKETQILNLKKNLKMIGNDEGMTYANSRRGSERGGGENNCNDDDSHNKNAFKKEIEQNEQNKLNNQKIDCSAIVTNRDEEMKKEKSEKNLNGNENENVRSDNDNEIEMLRIKEEEERRQMEQIVLMHGGSVKVMQRRSSSEATLGISTRSNSFGMEVQLSIKEDIESERRKNQNSNINGNENNNTNEKINNNNHMKSNAVGQLIINPPSNSVAIIPPPPPPTVPSPVKADSGTGTDLVK